MTSIQLDEVRVERLIDLMDRKDKINQEIRGILSENVFKNPEPKQKPNTAMELALDISGIDWKRSNRQGGGPADPSDGWAWAFAFKQDGGVLRETMQLLQALEQYGTVRVGEYEISRGGRDGNLLNRKKLKKRGY